MHIKVKTLELRTNISTSFNDQPAAIKHLARYRQSLSPFSDAGTKNHPRARKDPENRWKRDGVTPVTHRFVRRKNRVTLSRGWKTRKWPGDKTRIPLRGGVRRTVFSIDLETNPIGWLSVYGEPRSCVRSGRRTTTSRFYSWPCGRSDIFRATISTVRFRAFLPTGQKACQRMKEGDRGDSLRLRIRRPVMSYLPDHRILHDACRIPDV